MNWNQTDLDLKLKNNPDIKLFVSNPIQAGKTKLSKSVQGELKLVQDKLYQELNEFREKDLSESQTQSNFVLWLRDNRKFYPQLASGFAIPNGGFRHKKTAITMKREGAEPGVSDYMILHPAKSHAGLIIEFKVKYNQPSDVQKSWLNRLSKNGFFTAVCWSTMDAQKLACWFYDLPKGLY